MWLYAPSYLSTDLLAVTCAPLQTPPALPSLAIIRLCSLLLSSRVIIDWHNLGYTILALRLGDSSPLVKLARTLERWTGRKAFAHLFVTHAMRRHLETEWRLEGHKEVLHDRPPKHFKKSSVREAHALWKGLAPRIQPGLEGWWPAWDKEKGSTTPFTSTAAGQASLRSDRPALAVSSTSWTADEDFGLLLRAAQQYEKRAREVNQGSQLASTGRQGSAAGRSSSPFSDSQQHSHSTILNSSPPTSSPDRFSPSPKKRSAGLERHSTSLSLELPQAGATAPDRTATPPLSGSSSFEAPPISPSNPRAPHRHRRPSNLSLRSSTPPSTSSGPGAAATYNLPNLPANHLPKLLIIVTGKGALRSHYERRIAQLERDEAWQYVRIRTAWLENWEYPVLLGAADVGVSLHTSSSGLDLPMKVVDMLGCKLPVLALDFPCLDELIQHGRNGLAFRDEDELCAGLESLLGKFLYEEAKEGVSSGGNWLMRGGGMEDPFALAGRYTSQPAEGRRSGGQTPRESLEVGDGDERSTLLSSRPRSVEFSKGGLPTSTSFGPVTMTSSSSASSLSHPSSPSPGTTLWRLGRGGRTLSNEDVGPGSSAMLPPPRPSTPTPSFTMLASPLLGAQMSPPRSENGHQGGGNAAGPTTWAANWKAKVRPLLRLTDGNDTDEEDDDSELFTTADQFAPEAQGSGTNMMDWGGTTRHRPTAAAAAASGAGAGAGNAAVIRNKTRKQRRVRGDSVHGLLWSEDFGLTPLSSGTPRRPVAEAYAFEDDDGGDDEESKLLSSLGIIVTRASPVQHRKGHSRGMSKSQRLSKAISSTLFSGGGGSASPRGQQGQHARKRSDEEDEDAEDLWGKQQQRRPSGSLHGASSSLAHNSAGYAIEADTLDQQQGQPLRHRSTKSGAQQQTGGDDGAGEAGFDFDEGIPDIRVSHQDT